MKLCDLGRKTVHDKVEHQQRRWRWEKRNWRNEAKAGCRHDLLLCVYYSLTFKALVVFLSCSLHSSFFLCFQQLFREQMKSDDSELNYVCRPHAAFFLTFHFASASAVNILPKNYALDFRKINMLPKENLSLSKRDRRNSYHNPCNYIVFLFHLTVISISFPAISDVLPAMLWLWSALMGIVNFDLLLS